MTSADDLLQLARLARCALHYEIDPSKMDLCVLRGVCVCSLCFQHKNVWKTSRAWLLSVIEGSEKKLSLASTVSFGLRSAGGIFPCNRKPETKQIFPGVGVHFV